MLICLRNVGIALLLWLPVVQAEQTALVDSHVHYTLEQTKEFAPRSIIQRMQQHQVVAAVVTSNPPQLVFELHQLSPNRIIPFLGVYEGKLNKQNWYQDQGLPARIQKDLGYQGWQGIGELHLFAPNRHSPVFENIVLQAAEHELPLLMHSDPLVIDRLFEINPEARVIWAHAGAYPYPPLLSDYLKRYPGLYIDLSMRNERIAPKGLLDPEWELLLIEFSDRFLVGMDTFSNQRWRMYGALIEETQHWLKQLPVEVKDLIAYQNATRLFMPSSD